MAKISKQTRTIIIIVVIVIFLGIIGAVIYFYRNELFPSKDDPEADVDQVTGKAISWRGDSFPLAKGSSGDRVRQLQAGLNMAKETNLSLDGKFGDKTLAAVREHYKADQVSESGYNLYIKPNLEKINAYIASKKNNGGGSNSSTTVAQENYVGKTVFAKQASTGYAARKYDDMWMLDDNQPLKYQDNQFVGIVEKDDNGWLICFRTNGTRIFFMKKDAKIGY